MNTEVEFAFRLYQLKDRLIWVLRKRRVTGAMQDDIVQQTLLALWRRRAQLEAFGSPELCAYATRACETALWQSYRSATRRGRLESEWAEQPPQLDLLPDELVSRAESLSILRRLPADLAKVLWACEFMGMTSAEVASALAIPIGTVKTRRRKARAVWLSCQRARGVY